MNIERRRGVHNQGQERQSQDITGSFGYALPSLGEMVGDNLPRKSPITGLPDLQRFPDTFGYPAIWGGSGRNEHSGLPPEPSRFDNLTEEELRAWTDTWTDSTREFALHTYLDILLQTPEQNRQDIEDIREEIALAAELAAEDILDPPVPMSDEAFEAYFEAIKESTRESYRRRGETPPILPGDAGYIEPEEADELFQKPTDVGVGEIDEWHLELLICADDARRRVIRSFPEYRNMSDDEFQQFTEKAVPERQKELEGYRQEYEERMRKLDEERGASGE